MRILQLRPNDTFESFRSIADLHCTEIGYGVLSTLGPTFLADLYRRLTAAPRTGVWLAYERDQPVGFLAGTADVHLAFRSILLRGLIPLAFRVLRAAISSRVLFDLPSTLAYPIRRGSKSLIARPRAELLAMATATSAQRQGVGRSLIVQLERALVEWGAAGSYGVSADQAHGPSNAFYRRLGFRESGTIAHHQLTLQFYVKEPDANPPTRS